MWAILLTLGLILFMFMVMEKVLVDVTPWCPFLISFLLLKKALDSKIPYFGMSVLTFHQSKWFFQLVCIWRQVLHCFSSFASFDLDTPSYPESLVHTPSLIQILPSWDHCMFLCFLWLLLPSARYSFSYCEIPVMCYWSIFYWILSLHA